MWGYEVWGCVIRGCVMWGYEVWGCVMWGYEVWSIQSRVTITKLEKQLYEPLCTWEVQERRVLHR